MTTTFSTAAGTNREADRWQSTVMITLAFWLSGSVLIDLVIMPGLATAGMTTQPGFAAAGYLLFGVFNRIELLCGALVMTGLMVVNYSQELKLSPRSILLSGLLLAITMIYTYILTPELSSWGLQLNLFEQGQFFPGTMLQMHYAYWILEVCKLILGVVIFWDCEQRKS